MKSCSVPLKVNIKRIRRLEKTTADGKWQPVHQTFVLLRSTRVFELSGSQKLEPVNQSPVFECQPSRVCTPSPDSCLCFIHKLDYCSWSYCDLATFVGEGVAAVYDVEVLIYTSVHVFVCGCVFGYWHYITRQDMKWKVTNRKPLGQEGFKGKWDAAEEWSGGMQVRGRRKCSLALATVWMDAYECILNTFTQTEWRGKSWRDELQSNTDTLTYAHRLKSCQISACVVAVVIGIWERTFSFLRKKLVFSFLQKAVSTQHVVTTTIQLHSYSMLF